MTSIAVVTDSTVQFPTARFAGQERVSVIPFEILQNNKPVRPDDQPKIIFPKALDNKNTIKLAPPAPAQLEEYFIKLARDHDVIIGIFSSSGLTKMYQNAEDAVASAGLRIPLHLIDARSTSAGLGFLVEFAAGLAESGIQPAEIERLVRSRIVKMYAIICTPAASYLYQNGLLDHAQATIVEMTGIFPIFSIEDGALVPLEKFKSIRHATAYLQEFLEEFDRVEHIALLHGINTSPHDLKLFKENIPPQLSETPFTKHLLNPATASLFGPNATGLFVIEK